MRGRRAPLLMLPSWLSSRGARVLPAATLILVAIATARMQDLMAIGVAHAAAVTWISCAGRGATGNATGREPRRSAGRLMPAFPRICRRLQPRFFVCPGGSLPATCRLPREHICQHRAIPPAPVGGRRGGEGQDPD